MELFGRALKNLRRSTRWNEILKFFDSFFVNEHDYALIWTQAIDSMDNFAKELKLCCERLKISNGGDQIEFINLKKLWRDLLSLIRVEFERSLDEDVEDQFLSDLISSALTLSKTYGSSDEESPCGSQELSTNAKPPSYLNKRYEVQVGFVFVKLERYFAMRNGAIVKELVANVDENNSGRFHLQFLDRDLLISLIQVIDETARRLYAPKGVDSFGRLLARLTSDDSLMGKVHNLLANRVSLDKLSPAAIRCLVKTICQLSRRSMFNFLLKKRPDAKKERSTTSFRADIKAKFNSKMKKQAKS